jgi:hypothetical protein
MAVILPADGDSGRALEMKHHTVAGVLTERSVAAPMAAHSVRRLVQRAGHRRHLSSDVQSMADPTACSRLPTMSLVPSMICGV